MTIFVNCAFKYRGIAKYKKSIKRQYFKDFLFLVLIDIFYMVRDLFSIIYGEENESSNSARQLYVNDAIKIFFLTIVTIFILKYKYYKHHIISIAAIVILSIIIDIILENFTHTSTFVVLDSILYILADSLIYSYYKYLIEIKYYYFMDILFAGGIIYFSTSLISFFILLLVQNYKGSKTILSQVLEYYERVGVGYILFQFFFMLIIGGFLAFSIEFFILNELTPNYAIIASELGKIPISIILNEGINRWIILIVSIFQIIFLLFYLEIFEFNFCSLNENTKRNISEREQRQKNDDNNNNNDDGNEIIVRGYDITEGFTNRKESTIELTETIESGNDDN